MFKIIKGNNVLSHFKGFWCSQKNFYGLHKILQISVKPQESSSIESSKREPVTVGITPTNAPISGEIFPTTSTRVVPMLLAKREPVVLPFDEVPGPASLKFLARTRYYLSEVGTQLTAGALTLGLNIGAYISNRKPTRLLSSLFDEYGPIVRFVSPIGGDIVLINHPEHIQKVFSMEGDRPVRSALDSLDKYRKLHRNTILGGLYNLQGEDWHRHRAIVTEPLKNAIAKHMDGLDEISENFVKKMYNSRDYHDELTKDLYKEIHKWTFDCMGLLIFSKKFSMLSTDVVYSQCDMSWLYHSLEKSTEALLKCESGLQMWKLLPTPSWNSLVKNCDSLDNLIGKQVMESEQQLTYADKCEDIKNLSMINALLVSDDRMTPENVATIVMDMLLIGVNTITSSMSFLLYYLAKHQKVQKTLSQDIDRLTDKYFQNMEKVKEETPYLQACIKETLRLTPPIPVLTRILPKNITLDSYNIPRDTLIIMSTQDASLKESNFDDANKFCPERWLTSDASDYHAFASIPFGFGVRRCLGQNIAETLMTILLTKTLQRFKLEYHYGDIQPTRTFIVKPNKQLKIRFIDRM
ncbi:probable cytochrome P450 301a1, mitochondrial [Pectinophora gossypiella]|uniref:probable cytochrome P450 301a1, mitochondrial n=1 Tax=Pectinophora gossypiella TaxID=13191 RepID=UPI00214F5724|nr:probable cytochrome P450 301a1, mitochondrial [Pectinophora gossypiella]